ncbi:FAD-dependent oxidoreductase [Natronorubrum sp. DTA7]|uniref:FAD-dependent oxidoreductase n=1 Tax=Natronorubrum sp. DTA7 TaxID=3447016 RepID=UPI003F87F6D8
MASTEPGTEREYDYNVVVVGGGPAGCSVGLFTARYGLDTVIFDRGNSSIQRCAYLENYLGFPKGIGIEMFYGLMHDHAEEAGCELVSDLIESVTRTGDGNGFVVNPQEGDPVTARRVVAATRYDGEYMRPLGDDAMFTTVEEDGEENEIFDREYAEIDGETPFEGLYIASPSEEASQQAITAAGRGSRVALRVLTDVRRERGYPDDIAETTDWMIRKAERTGEWAKRDRWREWLDEQRPADHGLDDETWRSLRERELDRQFDTVLSNEEIDERAALGQERLLDHIDDNRIIARAQELQADQNSAEADD